ncbi:hypothetical protein MKX47_05370 [Solibacillus sp. FSL R7-0668]|uniref:hypothetical protein n=1 Tax=Solibacillus sp. FSL R7-0668 TaxID=2921688 RepID=UPI0030FAB79C
MRKRILSGLPFPFERGIGLIENDRKNSKVDDNTYFITMIDEIEAMHSCSLVYYTGDYAQ